VELVGPIRIEMTKKRSSEQFGLLSNRNFLTYRGHLVLLG